MIRKKMVCIRQGQSDFLELDKNYRQSGVNYK